MVYELVARAGMTPGVTWAIGDAPLVIGRETGCTIRIADASVSRRHCQVAIRDGVAWMEDLGSRNTTLLNGRPTKRHRLKPGDVLSVGLVRLELREQDEALTVQSERRPEGSTITLAQHAVAYLRHDGASMFERDLSRTVADLAELFHLAQTLWTAKDSDAAIEIFMQWCRDRFRSGCERMYIGGRNGGGVPLALARSRGEFPALLDQHLATAVSDRAGVLVPLAAKREEVVRVTTLAVAPIALGDEALGAVALISGPEVVAYDESDLQLLMAGANSLAPFLRSLLLIEQMRGENEQLRLAHPDKPVLVGTSRAMGQLRNAIRKAAQHALPVIVQGETGTGKELVAHLIHELSSRRDKPYYAINCAAVPKELFESELFGYERGAFTGAIAAKPGIVKMCDGGTLFLDEVGELSAENQAKLLRFLDSGTIRPVGAVRDIRVDVRLIAATNRDLGAEIARGSFRKDLYYRLDGLTLRAPSLAERPSDIPVLVRHFVELARRHSGIPYLDIDPEVMDDLTRRQWPGNVRELRHAVHRALAQCRDGCLRIDDFTPQRPAEAVGVSHTLAEHEAAYIAAVLRHHGGRVAAAAHTLGIGRTTLYDKIARYGLNPSDETVV